RGQVWRMAAQIWTDRDGHRSNRPLATRGGRGQLTSSATTASPLAKGEGRAGCIRLDDLCGRTVGVFDDVDPVVAQDPVVADHDSILLAEVATPCVGRGVNAPPVDLDDEIGLEPVEVESVLAMLAEHDLDLGRR